VLSHRLTHKTFEKHSIATTAYSHHPPIFSVSSHRGFTRKHEIADKFSESNQRQRGTMIRASPVVVVLPDLRAQQLFHRNPASDLQKIPHRIDSSNCKPREVEQVTHKLKRTLKRGTRSLRLLLPATHTISGDPARRPGIAPPQGTRISGGAVRAAVDSRPREASLPLPCPPWPLLAAMRCARARPQGRSSQGGGSGDGRGRSGFVCSSQ
jgi:hypothetical protein